MTLVPLALLLMAMAPAGEAWDALRTRIESAPRDVSRFIERRAGCNHFSGEEPYDRARAAEIRNALRALRCTRLERDGRALRRAYRNRPAILSLLSETEGLGPW